MSNQRPYTGHSGQLAVMAELLFRQCNVAIPELDFGTDVFAFREDRPEVTRLQVKAAQGKRYRKEEGYAATFDIPLEQLRKDDIPPLFYVLAARVEGQWTDFLILTRPDLKRFWEDDALFGTENLRSGNLVLTIQFRPGSVRCGEVDLTPFRNAWGTLPPLQPVPVARGEETEPLSPP